MMQFHFYIMLLMMPILVLSLAGCPGKLSGSVQSIAPSILQSNFHLEPTTLFLTVGQSKKIETNNGVAPYQFAIVLGEGKITADGIFLGTVKGSTMVKSTDNTGAVAYVAIEVSEPPRLKYPSAIMASTVVNAIVENGREPYSFSIVSGEGQIDATTGEFIASPSSGTARIRVIDANEAESEAVLQISANLTFAASSVSVQAGEKIAVSPAGGVEPIALSVVGNGSLDLHSREYTASSTQGLSLIQATDSQGNTAFLVVKVSSNVATTEFAVSPSSVILGAGQSLRFSLDKAKLPVTVVIDGNGETDASLIGAFDSNLMEFRAPMIVNTNRSITLRFTDSDPNHAEQSVNIQLVGQLDLESNQSKVAINSTIQISPRGGSTTTITPSPTEYSYFATRGTVTASGLYTAPSSAGTDVIVVTDKNGYTETLYINVVEVFRLAPSSAQISQNSIIQLFPVGGKPPYLYSIKSGNGILDPVDGVFKAPDQAGDVVIEVQDANNELAQSNLKILGHLMLAPLNSTTLAGQTIDFTISGGVSPYTVTLEGVSPKGSIVTVDGTNFQYQSPVTVSDKFNQSIKITDSEGETITGVVVVNPPLEIQAGLSSVLLDHYTEITVEGGIGPYSFTVDNSAVGEIVQWSSNQGQFTAKQVGTATVKVTDSRGQTSEIVITVTPDYSMPPSAVLTNVPTGLNNTIVLSVNVGGDLVSSYQYKIGTAATTNCLSSNGYSNFIDEISNITDNIAALPDGDIKLCVLGKNSNGISQYLALATQATWTKDTSPPVLGVTSPIENGFLSSGTQSQLNIQGSCEGSGGPVQISGAISSSTNCSAGSFAVSLDISSLAEGSFVLNFNQQDSAGNSATQIVRNLFNDKTAPSAVTISGGSWASSVATPQLSWTATTDSGSGLDTYEYAIGTTSDSQNILNWTPTAALTLQLTGQSFLENTSYYFSVRAKDKAGNIANVSSKSFSVDAAAPTTPGSVADGSSTASLSATPALSWNASGDSGSGVDHYEVAVGSTANGSDISSWVNVGNVTTASVTGLNLVNGNTYYSSVRAVDVVGNISAVASGDGWTVSVNTFSGVSASSMNDHACQIRSGGSLYCWGYNLNGQIGNNATGTQLTPFQVFSSGATYASVNKNNTCAIVSGALWCWGQNAAGIIGNNTTVEQRVPYKVIESGVSAVSVGNHFVCAIVNGALWCWGSNGYGQLGNNTTVNQLVPTQIISSGVTDIQTQGDANSVHVCAIVSGALYCWGRNASGQIGNNSTTDQLVPVQIFSAGVTKVSLGGSHSCALVNGAVWCWGANGSGQIGNNLSTASIQKVPAQIIASGVSDIDLSATTSCAIVNGALFCWGANNYGQLGINSTALSVVPAQVFSSGVTSIKSGNSHRCAIVNGALKCWGYNSNGQVGTGSTGNRLSPYEVFASNVSDVIPGEKFTFAIVNGVLKVWGNNDGGQAGINSTTNVWVPTTVSGN